MTTVDTSFAILVIFLSTALGIFLVLGIILLVNLIKISNYIKHITEKAEQIADRAESMSAFFEKSTAPVFVGRLLSNIMDSIKAPKKKHGRKWRDEDDE